MPITTGSNPKALMGGLSPSTPQGKAFGKGSGEAKPSTVTLKGTNDSLHEGALSGAAKPSPNSVPADGVFPPTKLAHMDPKNRFAHGLPNGHPS